MSADLDFPCWSLPETIKWIETKGLEQVSAMLDPKAAVSVSDDLLGELHTFCRGGTVHAVGYRFRLPMQPGPGASMMAVLEYKLGHALPSDQLEAIAAAEWTHLAWEKDASGAATGRLALTAHGGYGRSAWDAVQFRCEDVMGAWKPPAAELSAPGRGRKPEAERRAFEKMCEDIRAGVVSTLVLLGMGRKEMRYRYGPHTSAEKARKRVLALPEFNSGN